MNRADVQSVCGSGGGDSNIGQWFHGTMHEFDVGEMVLPAKAAGVPLNHPMDHSGTWVHITRSPAVAWFYANFAWQMAGRPQGPKGLLFEVEPIGDVLERTDYKGEYTSPKARVIRRVPSW